LVGFSAKVRGISPFFWAVKKFESHEPLWFLYWLLASLTGFQDAQNCIVL
jgi:hypothetical protein